MTSASKLTTWTCEFDLGKEFEMKTMDGRKMKVGFISFTADLMMSYPFLECLHVRGWQTDPEGDQNQQRRQGQHHRALCGWKWATDHRGFLTKSASNDLPLFFYRTARVAASRHHGDTQRPDVCE